MTLYTLKTFKENIKNIARPNRFTVEVDFPWEGVSSRAIYTDSRFKFFANKASIPQFDIVGPVFNYRGTHVQLPGDYKKEPLTIGFYNDDGWEVRSFFEDWMRSCVNYDGRNRRMRLVNSRYGANIVVDQYGNSLDENGQENIIARYVYKDAIPLQLTTIELDHGQQNTIEEFQVLFHYSHWEREITADRESNSIQTEDSMESVVNNTDRINPNTKPELDETTEREDSPAGVKIPVEEIIGLPIDSETGNINWDKVSDDFKKQYGENLPRGW